MRLKPTCDVETIEDFDQYYRGAFVQLRDVPESVFQVSSVRHGAKGQVVLTEVDRENWLAQGPLSLMTWEEARNSIIFGKVPGGMIDCWGQVYWMYEQNNRHSSRGFHPTHVQMHNVGGSIHADKRDTYLRFNRSQMQEQRAWCVFNRAYTPIQLYANELAGPAIALSFMYAVAPEQERGVHLLYRRSTAIGVWDTSKQRAVLGPTEYKKYAGFLVRQLGVPCYERN